MLARTLLAASRLRRQHSNGPVSKHEPAATINSPCRLSVPIVAFAPGDKADLKPGTKIFILAAKKLPDGTLQAARVNYGNAGLTPPM